MKNRFTILIIASVAALLSLVAIQSYLIYNTYQLESKSLIREIDESLDDVTLTTTLDSLYVSWGDKLMNDLSDEINGRLEMTDVMSRMYAHAASLSIPYKEAVEREIASRKVNYEVDFKRKLIFVVIYQGTQIDTVYLDVKGQRSLVFGADFSEEQTEAHTINKSTWFTEHEYISLAGDSISTKSFDIEIRTHNVVLIKDWKPIVFGRMSILLILSVLLFLFVVGLLYYSIRNLISQKRIADVKTDFINNITHELKTPLATMSIASKSLRSEALRAKPKAYEQTLDIVDRQNERLQKLIDQVMNNSLSSEEITLNKEQLVDNIYFADVISDFKLSAQHPALTIYNKVCSDEVILRLDKFHFTTALLNVLENSVKYGKEMVELTLQTEVRNSEYIISVSDNGIGISERDQKQLFEKFYRVTAGDRHDVKGLGLGLYLVDQIVKAHHGHLEVSSELHKGSTFTIRIPMK